MDASIKYEKQKSCHLNTEICKSNEKKHHKNKSNKKDKIKKELFKELNEKDNSKSNSNIITNKEKMFNNSKIKEVDKNLDNAKNIKNHNKSKNFWQFVLFKLSFEKKNNFFKMYRNFRIKIISEEHLVRNHLTIYNLLRVNEKKINAKKRHSFHLNDLINLV